MTHPYLRSAAGTIFALSAFGLIMQAQPAIAMGSWVEGEETNNCNIADGALNEAAFVITTAPRAGDRVESGFAVAGCSRSFEGSVEWKLVGHDGSVIANGNTRGGGVDGPGAFAFTVPYSLEGVQVGHLEGFEEDASDGEGFPPGRTILPLVLKP